MMHKAWCSIEEVPYCFPRPSIKFQGHKGQKIDDLDQIWARLLGRSQLSNPSDLPCLGCNYLSMSNMYPHVLSYLVAICIAWVSFGCMAHNVLSQQTAGTPLPSMLVDCVRCHWNILHYWNFISMFCMLWSDVDMFELYVQLILCEMMNTGCMTFLSTAFLFIKLFTNVFHTFRLSCN